MEDVSTLKSENEKLQGRLKKAVDVFNEQKNDITRLTSERDAALNSLKEKEALIAEFEAKLQEKSQDDGKFFEALGEIDALNETVATQAQKIEEQNKEISNAREKLEGMMNSMTTLVGSIKTGADAIMSNAKDILSSIKSSKIL